MKFKIGDIVLCTNPNLACYNMWKKVYKVTGIVDGCIDVNAIGLYWHPDNFKKLKKPSALLKILFDIKG